MNITKENKTTEAGPVKRILLKKHHDITAFASSDATRYVLNGINYNGAKKVLEATDGKACIRVPVEESAEFPPVAKLDSLPAANDGNCDIPVKPFRKALGNIPKSKLPVLNSVRLDVEPAKGNVSTTTFHLTTNDLDTVTTLSGRAIEGQYPNIDQVIPTEEPKLTIALSGALLLKIAQYAVKHGLGQCPVKLSFTEELKPVRFAVKLADGGEATGVLMPMRLA